MPMHQTLFGLPADGSSGVLIHNSGRIKLFVVAGGDFSGGTLTVSISPDDGPTFVDSGQASLTAPGVMIITIPDSTLVSLKLDGSSTPSLNAWASHPIPSSGVFPIP